MSSQEDPKTTNAFQSLIDATKQFSQSIKKLRSLPGPPEYIICIHPAAAAGAYEKKKQTADLIDRQEAIDALMEKDKKLRNLNWYDNPYAEGECAGIDEALSIISNLPLVQPVQPERKRGHWIDAYPDIEPNPMFMYGICSVCGCEQAISNKLNFCPDCGADMRGEKNEND